VDGLKEGLSLYRNIDTAFEKELDRNPSHREVSVALSVRVHGKWNIDVTAVSEDGREFTSPFKADLEKAENRDRAEAMLREQLGKRSLHYHFHVDSVDSDVPGAALPLLSASTINSIRRLIAEDLDSMLAYNHKAAADAPSGAFCRNGLRSSAEEDALPPTANELMKSKYCIKYELGMCPNKQGAKPMGPLYLLNNGRLLALHFDCKACEMGVMAAPSR